MMQQKLSSIEEKLNDTPTSSSSEQSPIAPVTQQSTLEPTHSTMMTITTLGSVETTGPEEEDRRPSITTGSGQLSSTTEEGRNTNAPTGEPTTPLTESTESRATGATGNVPQTEEEPGTNTSSSVSEGWTNSTESIDTATREEQRLGSTTEGVPLTDYDSDSGEDLGDDKDTNEQAIEALRSELASCL